MNSIYFVLWCFIFHQDPVLNVRLKFCSVLPSLKSVLKLPSDRQLLQQLELCVRKLLSSEQDVDMSASVREVSRAIDRSCVTSLPLLSSEQDTDSKSRWPYRRRTHFRGVGCVLRKISSWSVFIQCLYWHEVDHRFQAVMRLDKIEVAMETVSNARYSLLGLSALWVNQTIFWSLGILRF